MVILLGAGTVFFGTFIYSALVVAKRTDECELKKDDE